MLNSILQKTLFVFVCLCAITWLVGRIPMEGSVIVSQANSKYVADILAQEQVMTWYSNSSLSGTRFVFKNPLALARVDDLIALDAKEKGYWVSIEYYALLPILNSKTIVNEKQGIFGKNP